MTGNTDFDNSMIPFPPEPDVSQFGLAQVPLSLIIREERDAVLVLAAIQLRRDTARRIREQAEQMAAQAERAAAWIEERFKQQLEGFTRSRLTGKAKGIKLITGQGGNEPTVMGFRTSPTRLKIVDQEQAVANAPSAEFIRTKVTNEPIADKFKEHWLTTGEIPAGCEVVPKQEVFYIK